MEGVTIVETKVLQELILKLETLSERVEVITKDAMKPYLTVQEVMQLTRFSIDWVNDHKQDIGYSNVGRTIRFKRKDVEYYMEANYFKTKSRRTK